MKTFEYLLAVWSLASITESSPASMATRYIQVYTGPGVGKPLAYGAIKLFNKILPSTYKIKEIDAKELEGRSWMSKTDLMIIPGGVGRHYCTSLNGKPNSNIKDYVKGGGSFFGICAGSYFSAKDIGFYRGTPGEIVGPRELSFYPDTVEGPVFKTYECNSNRGACATKVEFGMSGQSRPIVSSVFWNGGGSFMNAYNHKDVQVLANYKEVKNSKETVAAVLVNVGKGKALLSAVHPEYIPSNPDDLLYNKLKPEEIKIINVLADWLQKLNIQVNQKALDDINQGRSAMGRSASLNGMNPAQISPRPRSNSVGPASRIDSNSVGPGNRITNKSFGPKGKRNQRHNPNMVTFGA